MNRMKGNLNETTLIFAHHRINITLSEGPLSETTLKYEIPIYCKRVLVNKIKGTQNKTTLIFALHRNNSIVSEGPLSETTLKYEIPRYCKRAYMRYLYIVIGSI